jgi:colicin import membrane protein
MTELTNNSLPFFQPVNSSQWTSMFLAGTVHLLLIAFLWLGVQWQSKVTTAVEAEVWDMTVRQAAPLPVEAVPPEPIVEKITEPLQIKEEPKEDPEIAIAQEKKKRQLEQDKIQELRKKREKELELAKKKEQEKLAALKLQKDKEIQDKIFVENMRRLSGQASKVGGVGDSAKSTGNNRGDPSYADRIAAKVRPNTIYVVSDTSSNNPTVEYQINLFPDGSLRGPLRKEKSSGVLAFDEAVEKAIEKSLPFPRDKSGSVPPSIHYVHKMKD